ncbi:hypothetical protein [Spirillospora sp. NPDC077959]|uniref:hypothetical protein n=1 Tax=Spirillospora sp. NPDC077959 TaxID=3364529 RepID=UPI0037D96AC9
MLPLIIGIAASVTVGAMASAAPEPVEAFRTGERADVELAEEGLTVLFGKGWKVGVSVRCSVHDADGEPVRLTYGNTSQEVTFQGTKWYPAYETSDPQPPGRYTVLCEADGNDIEVAVAPSREQGQGQLFDTLQYVTLLAGLAVSMAVMLLIFVLRQRSKRARG